MKILLVVATEQEVIKDKFKDCKVLITGMGMVNTSIQITKELLPLMEMIVIFMIKPGELVVLYSSIQSPRVSFYNTQPRCWVSNPLFI